MTLLDLALTQLSKEGLTAFSYPALAKTSKIPLADLLKEFPEPIDFLKAYLLNLHEVFEETFEPSLETSTHEILLEGIMILCDLFTPQKLLLQTLRSELPETPCVLKEMTDFLEKTLLESLLNKARLPLSGIQGFLRRKAFLLFFLKLFNIYLKDQTPDLSYTLKEADQGLYTLETLKESFNKFSSLSF